MLHIVPEVTIVLVAIGPSVFFPFAWAFFQTVSEVADIRRTVAPAVGAKAVWLTMRVLSAERVAVLVRVAAFAMLQTILKLSFVAVAVFPLVHSVAIDLAVSPLTNVGVASCAFPDAKALLDACDPLTIVLLTVGPREDALTVRLVVMVLAQVCCIVGEKLIATSIAQIILPLALVDTSVLVDQDTQALALPLN